MPEQEDRDALERLHQKSQRLKDQAARLLREAHDLDERIQSERKQQKEAGNGNHKGHDADIS